MSPPSVRHPFEINKELVAAGTVQRTEVPISTLSTGTVLSVPVVVMHGKFEGPTLLVSAAIHGDEINGIEVIRRFMGHVKPARLKGTVVTVPIFNVFGYLTRSRYLPDRRDLNRSFPGSRKGSLASQLAHWFTNEVLVRCDVAVDLHTGSDNRINMPQIRCDLDVPSARELGMAFGAPILAHSNPRPNSMRAAAAELGLPMLVFEGGEALRFDPWSLDVGVRGLRQLLVYLEMQNSTDLATVDVPYVALGSSWVRVKRGGVWHSDVRLGDEVAAGQPLGKVTDIYGTIRSRCAAPYPGKVVGMAQLPNVSRGDAVLHIAVPFSLKSSPEIE